MAYHEVQAVVSILNQLREVVADSVRITETVAVSVSQAYCRLVLVAGCRYVLYIISGCTPETLVVLVVVVISEFGPDFEVLEYFPSECSCKVEGLALLLAVVVVL